MTSSILRHGSFWALVPVVLLGSLVALQLLLVRLVLSDASFSVEKSYYSKALDWDETRARELASAKLGWNVDAVVAVHGTETEIAVALFDRTGSALHGATVDVEAFAVARADRVVRSKLREDPDGSYRARLPMDRAGRWEFALRASRGTEHFRDVFRRDLTTGTGR